jgi:hypothetical protein
MKINNHYHSAALKGKSCFLSKKIFRFGFFSLSFFTLLYMLRSLSRVSINNTSKLLRTRAFHDCPINSIQPLRLLLIGCPVSLKNLVVVNTV